MQSFLLSQGFWLGYTSSTSCWKSCSPLTWIPSLTRWISEYLTNRSQQVVVDGAMSSACIQVLSGVPQGSVLRPFLFLIYIDQVTTVSLSQSSNLNLFADNVLLYNTISRLEDYTATQDDINAIADCQMITTSCWTLQCASLWSYLREKSCPVLLLNYYWITSSTWGSTKFWHVMVTSYCSGMC